MHGSKGEARTPPESMAQVSFHVGKECLARQVTNVSSEWINGERTRLGTMSATATPAILFNQLSSWSKVAANVHIFAYDSRRPPGFTTTVAIDSNLLGIDFHSQPVVLPAVEVFGEVRLGECFDAFVCGLMPRLHPPAARTSPPGLARPWRLAGWRRRMEC